MIIERREYGVARDKVAEFWAVQRDWYWPPEIGDFFNHLVGYFQTLDDAAPSIIHLYRFQSLGEWETRYQALYKRFPPDYFTVVRQLLTSQSNTFLMPAPLQLPGIGDLAQAAGPPADYTEYGSNPAESLVIQETITSFRPGGLFDHWNAVREAGDYGDAARQNLIGVFSSLTGRFHRKFEYRWFHGREDATRNDDALRAAADTSGLADRTSAFEIATTSRLLRPAPFPWLRPLFQEMDWSVFEDRDPALRRIAPWPPSV